MKNKILILQWIFTAIVGVTFYFGIVANPTFNLYDFCINLSSEFIGWILAVTLFQYYYDAKIAARKSAQKKEDASSSIADEIAKLKSLLDTGVITAEEFETGKSRILSK